MKFEVFTKPEANKEILEAAGWYEDQQLGLGLRFLDELENVLFHLEKEPLIFEKKHLETREAPLQIFPFVVVYQVDGNTVIVLAVFHTSRNPTGKIGSPD
ncbi:MAG: type II toxin-antitoxin system RelE/ParE family toxin [Flavobacteriales bacterium]|nr:type II toxin-antitoxin system RelE/ParE family toxin [Flavobacteriales bacterium]